MAMTLQLDDEASAALSRIAKARGQSPDAFLKEAILDLAAEEEELLAAFLQGERDIEEGRVHTHEEALAILKAMRGEAEGELARRNHAA